MTEPIYTDLLLRHSRHPMGAIALSPDQAQSTLSNPVCGDEIRLRLIWDTATGRLLRFEHETRGCAVCRASASLAAQLLPGHTPDEIRQLADTFRTALTTDDFTALPPDYRLFQNLRQYPSRLHCALLPWQALSPALP